MTADHTPERLSEEDPEAEALADSIAGCFSNVSDLPEWMQVQALGRYMRPLALLAARAVLASDWYAAHLADVEARLASVYALADRWQRLATIADSGRVGTTAATAYTQAADELVVALRTSEALVDGLPADAHGVADGGRGLPSVAENFGLEPEGALDFPRQDAEVGERVKGDVVVGAEPERQECALGGVTGIGGGVEHESTLVDLGGGSQPGLTAISDAIARVEALADEWERLADGADRGSFAKRERWTGALRARATEVRAALHPDPSEVARDE